MLLESVPVSRESANPAVRVAFASHWEAATAVERCRHTIGAVQPTMLLAFCGGKHDATAVFKGFSAAYPGIPIVGGSAAGAIGCGELGYSGLEIGVVAFTDAGVTPRLHVTRELLGGEAEAGARLGHTVSTDAEDGAVVLLFFDSVASTAPIRLHPASALVEGFHQGLGAKKVNLIGGGLLTDINFSDGWMFDGSAVSKHCATALVFPRNVQAETAVLHGCRPVSSFMQITRINGAVVYELDDEPALTVIERMLGLRIGSADGTDLSLVATLGEKHGDMFAPYDENAYVNRLILGADRANGSITLFEPDFRVGTMVQIMSRDNKLMLDSARDGTQKMSQRAYVSEPFLTLYIDCAGRASARSGAVQEEASLVMNGFDPSYPLLGFYSGVEIAPFEGYSRPLDWTGVLTSLRRVS